MISSSLIQPVTLLYFDRDGSNTSHSASVVCDFSANGAVLANTDIVVFA